MEQNVAVIQKSIKIGSVLIKNRIGLAPINTGLLLHNGSRDAYFFDFFKQYFENQIGLVYIGGLAVNSSGRANKSSFVFGANCNLNAIEKVISDAKKKSTKVILQLEHAGRQANPDEILVPIFAPSALACPIVKRIPREMSQTDINNVVEDFASAAVIANNCGADFVEVHAAHGYLISGFISPFSNIRQDKYGGSFKNRFRLLFEIIESIKARTNIPIGIRINCTDNRVNGVTFSDIINAIELIRDSLSYISITGGVYAEHDDVIIPSPKRGIAIWQDYAKILKKRMGLPLFLAGNINSIAVANKLLVDDVCDITLIGRGLLANPMLLSNYLNGTPDYNICNYCYECKYHSHGKEYITCPINPILNRIS